MASTNASGSVSISNTNTSTSTSTSSATTREADTKISNDLAVLGEKMDLLGTLLNSHTTSSSSSSSGSSAWNSVVGYLDACGPRMIELVTACSGGGAVVLSESVFGNVLASNDRLQKLLSDADVHVRSVVAASTTVAAAAAPSSEAAASNDPTEQFGDLLLGGDDDNNNNANANAHAKTTGETGDDFDFKPAAKPAATPTPTTTTNNNNNDDPFDDFFAERTAH